MTLNELQIEVDNLISKGYGECDVCHCIDSYMAYFDNIYYNEDEDEIVIE